MSLTVLTHTRGDDHQLLRRACASVERALPAGAQHKVIVCPTYNNWVDRRWRDMIESEYVAIVDDDDEIHPQSLQLCYDAVVSSGVGVAFTNEIVMHPDGAVREYTKQRWYQHVITTPRTIHGLCVFNTKYIDRDVGRLCKTTNNAGIDWYIKASAALTGGALHVPMNGYCWHLRTLQPHQESGRDRIANQRPAVCANIKRLWGDRTGPIPQLDLSNVTLQPFVSIPVK